MNSRAGFVYSTERPNNAEMTMATKPHGPASYFPSIEAEYGRPATALTQHHLNSEKWAS
jgi:hypothetical protein